MAMGRAFQQAPASQCDGAASENGNALCLDEDASGSAMRRTTSSLRYRILKQLTGWFEDFDRNDDVEYMSHREHSVSWSTRLQSVLLNYENITVFEKSATDARASGRGRISVSANPKLTGEERLQSATSAKAFAKLLKFTENVLCKDVQTSGVDKDTMMEVLLANERRSKTCLALPITLAFFCSFVAFFQRHYSSSSVYLQETSLRFHLTDAASNMHALDDIYTYLSGTFFPVLWSCTNTPGNKSGLLPTRHLVLAGASLTTSWGSMEACEGNPPQGNLCPDADAWTPETGSGWVKLNRRLSPVVSASTGSGIRRSSLSALPTSRSTIEGLESTEAFAGFASEEALPEQPELLMATPAEGSRAAARSTSPASELSPLPATAALLPAFPRRTKLLEGYLGDVLPPPYGEPFIYSYTLPATLALQEVSSFTESLRTNQVIRRDTRYLSVEAIVWNEGMENGLVTRVEVTFLFNRGGTIFTDVRFQTETSGVIASLGAFIGWVACLLIETFSLLQQMLAAKFAGRLREHWSTLHHVVDIVLFAYAWFILAVFVYERALMAECRALWDVDEQRSGTSASQLEAHDGDWYDSLASIVRKDGNVDNVLMILVADYHILFILRILLASRGQARLALVVSTMSRGLVDMLHLAVVIAIIFAAYMVSGHVMFGRNLEDFSTLKGALGYLLHILFQREYDWNGLTEQWFYTSGFWCITFLLMIVLVLTNLMLAMVFGIYAEIRSGMDENDTVIRSSQLIMNRLKNMSDWVSNVDMLRAINSVKSETTIDRTLLMRFFPHMCKVQLDSLFEDAKRQRMNMMTKQHHNVLLPETIACTLLSVDSLRRAVKTVSENKKADLNARKGFHRARGTNAAVSALDDDAQPVWLRCGLMPHLEQQVAELHALSRQLDEMVGSLENPGHGSDPPAAPPATSSIAAPIATPTAADADLFTSQELANSRDVSARAPPGDARMAAAAASGAGSSLTVPSAAHSACDTADVVVEISGPKQAGTAELTGELLLEKLRVRGDVEVQDGLAHNQVAFV